MREVQREAASQMTNLSETSLREKDEKIQSSSSTSCISELVEDQTEGYADEGDLDKGIQVKPVLKSVKSQAARTKLCACIQCAKQKSEIRSLRKKNKRLRSQRQKWKEMAQGDEVSIITL